MSFMFVYFLIFGILQFILFHFATFNCGTIEGTYSYPGGGHGEFSTPADNLLPRHSLMIERPDQWFAQGFDVFNSTDNHAQTDIVGVWYRTWGPWFSTYTYQDSLNSKATLYIRATVMGMWFYTENLIMRCDGKDDPVVVTEGREWMANRIRSVLGSNTGLVFRILDEGSLVAKVKETHQGAKSATFVNTTTEEQQQFASAVLLSDSSVDEETGEHYRKWFMRNDYGSSMEYWKTTSTAAMYAFRMKAETDKRKKAKAHRNPDFLVEQFDGDGPDAMQKADSVETHES